MEEESDLSLELAIHRAGWTSTRRPGKPGGNMAGRAARQVGLPEGGLGTSPDRGLWKRALNEEKGQADQGEGGSRHWGLPR